MKKYFFWKRFMMVILFAFIFIVPLSFIVMTLWNNILVPVLHVAVINFWQALGIFALCKILFGGFPGRWGRRYDGHWQKEWGGMHAKRKEMMEKWHNMTPEERQKFKQEWRNRCRSWKYGERFDSQAGNASQEEKTT